MIEVKCPYCGDDAVLTDSAEVYGGRSYGMIWICRPCNAYVGTHKNSPDHEPLGRLADAELREWKKMAHAEFDPLWKKDGLGRHQAYAWLAGMLDIDRDDCHIGMFDIGMCQKVVQLCRLRRNKK